MRKKVLDLAIPNIISNITIPLVGLVDIWLMGHLESSVYIGAIALGSMIFTFVYAGFGFLRMGTSGFTAQAYGARNLEESILILSRALLIGLIIAFTLIIFQNPIASFSFWVIGGSPEVESLAREYFKIRIWAAPATLGIYALTGWYTGMQNAKIPMVIAIIVNIMNIIFSASFIFILDMKSDGVALGTVLAQYTGFIVSIIFFKKYYSKLIKYYSHKAAMNWAAINKFMKVNKDIMIRSLLLTGTFFYFTAESAVYGNDLLAVNSLMIQFLWILSYFMDGFAFAAEALVGKAIGMKDKKLLRNTVSTIFKMGLFVSIIVTIIYFFGNESIFRILTDKEDIITLSRDFEFWIWLMPLVTFAAFIWDGIYIGATAGTLMRNSMIIASLVLFLPIYYLFESQLGNHALWLALMFFMAARGIILAIYAPRKIYTIIH
jgi:MATE family multidrug resistance protein